MAKYRKKLIAVEAEQFFEDRKPWPRGILLSSARNPHKPKLFMIDTPEGLGQVSEGDWIITGILGERYLCKPDIFEATYDLVTPDAKGT